MPYKEPKIEKLYYTIGEVADISTLIPLLFVFGRRILMLLNPTRTRRAIGFLPRRILRTLS